MQIERWQYVQDLYFKALELPEAHRTPFLETACGHDPQLLKEIESLLESGKKIEHFLDPLPTGALEELVRGDLSTTSTDDGDELIGRTIDDRYVVTQRVGSGGMGDVFRADHRLVGTPVAIKRLGRRFRDRKDYRERFLEEARRALSLDHENVVRVKDVLEESNEVFVVMEFIDGNTLREYRDRRPTLEEFLDIATQCASGLAAAHEKNIAHLDIKPGNIMMTASRRVKICDFGVACQLKAAKDGEEEEKRWAFGGTPSYMAPEVLEGNQFDVRADIFSLGVVFYELLSGKHPFWSEDLRRTTARIVEEPPAPLVVAGFKVPSRLLRLIGRMLSKDSSSRLSATETLIELQKIQRRHHFVKGVRQAPGEVIPFARRRPATALSVAFAVMAVAGGAMYFRPLSMLGLNSQPEMRNVAVLPCRVEGESTPERERIARSTATMISYRLNEMRPTIPGLNVAPPVLMREFGIGTVDQARSEWGAQVVVDCEFAFSGNKVKATYSLIGTAEDSKDNRVLRRTEALEADADDKTFYEETIVRAVAVMLEIQIAPTSGTSTSSAEAFALYQQAIGALVQYDDPQNVERAINWLKDAVRLDSSYAAAYAALGHAQWYRYDASRQAADLEESLKACQQAASLADNADTQVCLGRVYQAMGRDQLAVEALQLALKYSPADAEATRLLGLQYEKMNRFEEAKAHYLQAISLRRDWVSYSWIAGFYSNGLHDYEKAAENYLTALSLSPNGKNARVFYSLGGAYGNLGRYDLAIKSLQSSINLRPDWSPVRAHSNLGLTYLRAREYNLALPELEKAATLVETSGDHAAIGNLARVLRLMGNKDRASEVYERAIARALKQLDSDYYNVDIHILLGRYYAMLGKADDSRRSIELALNSPAKGRRDDPHFQLIAATAYTALGDRKAAVDCVRVALKHGYGKVQVLAEPELDALATEPDFNTLMASLELPKVQ